MVDYFSIAYKKMQRDWEDAQCNNNIELFIKKYGIQEEIKYSQMDYPIINPNRAKILILGDLAVSKDLVYGLAKNILGMQKPKDRLDFVSCEEATNYDFRSVTQEKYTDMFIGPMPHSTRGNENYSSFLQKVKCNSDVYPNYIELKANQYSSNQKITKTALENAFANSYFHSLFDKKDIIV